MNHHKCKCNLVRVHDAIASLIKKVQHLTNKLRNNTYQSTCQSQQANWFHSLPFQQIQTLLTLFSKSFSSFPHGTCLLSVSNSYLALDEIYHPLYAPLPRNATLKANTVHNGLQEEHRILTHIDALFQEACSCAFVSILFRGYNPKPEASVYKPSTSLFIRHY